MKQQLQTIARGYDGVSRERKASRCPPGESACKEQNESQQISRTDYTGGAFLLVEQRPRAQSRGEAIIPAQGEIIIFSTRHRPVEEKRGYHRVTMRHGVSRVLSGCRYTLGVIFHDAQ